MSGLVHRCLGFSLPGSGPDLASAGSEGFQPRTHAGNFETEPIMRFWGPWPMGTLVHGPIGYMGPWYGGMGQWAFGPLGTWGYGLREWARGSWAPGPRPNVDQAKRVIPDQAWLPPREMYHSKPKAL